MNKLKDTHNFKAVRCQHKIVNYYSPSLDVLRCYHCAVISASLFPSSPLSLSKLDEKNESHELEEPYNSYNAHDEKKTIIN